jgi:hypothetical protein
MAVARTIQVAAFASLLTVAMVGLNAAPAGATPAPSQPSKWTNLPDYPLASVSPVDDAAAALGDVARADYAASFYDLTLSSGAIDLYMTDVTQAPDLIKLARHRMSPASKKVDVSVHAAAFSREALHAAASDLLNRSAALAADGVELYGVAVRADGSGLTVDTNAPEKAQSLLAAPGETSATPNLSRVKSAAPAAVSFQVGSKAEPTTRYDDYPPYAGGVYINTAPGHFCTSGFGMRQSNGTTAMITAAHCALPNTTITDGGGQVVGTVTSADTSRDAEVIPATTWQGVYTINESYTSYKNWAYNYNGQTVCQSGYTSNQICGLVVTNDDYFYTLQTDWGIIYHVEGVQASNTSCSGCVAVAGGDSGGPVWVGVTGGVQSRGINSAGQGGVIGYAPNGNPQYHTVLFNETGWILKSFGGSLLVG